jgi:DNA-directed RNA polymerase sigma subunit (sigma70/sigma32)
MELPYFKTHAESVLQMAQNKLRCGISELTCFGQYDHVSKLLNRHDKNPKQATDGLINLRLELTIMEYSHFEEGTLPEGGEYDPALDETETSSLYKETFSLRRVDYFNKAWNEKMISNKLCSALVDIIARRYVDRGVKLQYLLREGCLGLNHALENFELEGVYDFRPTLLV